MTLLSVLFAMFFRCREAARKTAQIKYDSHDINVVAIIILINPEVVNGGKGKRAAAIRPFALLPGSAGNEALAEWLRSIHCVLGKNSASTPENGRRPFPPSSARPLAVIPNL